MPVANPAKLRTLEVSAKIGSVATDLATALGAVSGTITEIHGQSQTRSEHSNNITVVVLYEIA